MFSRINTYFTLLRTDPLGFLVYMCYFAVTVLLSLILHECAHGYVALRCGDPTAQMMGRLSLDPRRHLDPMGTVCMLLIGVGWAKPVPVNPRNYRNYRRDDFLVSIAGICMNLTLFLLCSALSVVVNGQIWQEGFTDSFRRYYGSLQGLLNPYESTSGWASYITYGLRMSAVMEAAAHPWLLYVQKFLLMMASTNLCLAMFNLLPIPPLDGYHVVNDLLLRGRLQLTRQTFQWAQIALIVLMLSGVLSRVLTAMVSGVYGAVINLWLLIAGA